MMKLRPYPEYRDSGLEWLGEIPVYWKMLRVKNVLRKVDRRSSTGTEPLLSMTRGRGLVRYNDISEKPTSATTLVGYKVCEKGHVVMNRMQAWSGMFHIAPERGLVSPDYAVFAPIGDVNTAYLGYLLRSPIMVSQFAAESRGIGSGFLRLYTDRFGAIPFLLPSPEEQDVAVGYIKNIHKLINRFIRNKQRLIELLQEQKQAIINACVTGKMGVRRIVDENGNPSFRVQSSSCKMRDSRIDWLGKIPEHWEVLALKRVLGRLIDCEHKTAPAVERSDYRVVRTTAVRDGKLMLEGTYCTTADAYAGWTKRGLPEPGDVIFTREAPAGEACLVPMGQRVCLGQRTVLMKPNPAVYDARFLVYMIYGGPPHRRIRMASQGSTVGHFNMEDIAAMYVLVPPLHEQRELVAAIEVHIQDLDNATAKAQQEIDLIREYRTRLIADVVTGKVDVRGIPVEDIPEDEALEELVDEMEEDITDEDEYVEEAQD